MRAPAQRSTTWVCDSCNDELVLTDVNQDVPPKGWRLIGLWPVYVNLALEPHSKQEIRKASICEKCLRTPINVLAVFDV